MDLHNITVSSDRRIDLRMRVGLQVPHRDAASVLHRTLFQNNCHTLLTFQIPSVEGDSLLGATNRHTMEA